MMSILKFAKVMFKSFINLHFQAILEDKTYHLQISISFELDNSTNGE